MAEANISARERLIADILSRAGLPNAPLAMPKQIIEASAELDFRDLCAHRPPRLADQRHSYVSEPPKDFAAAVFLRRLAALIFSLIVAVAACELFIRYADTDGMSPIDDFRCALIAISTAWLAWGAALSLLGPALCSAADFPTSQWRTHQRANGNPCADLQRGSGWDLLARRREGRRAGTHRRRRYVRFRAAFRHDVTGDRRRRGTVVGKTRRRPPRRGPHLLSPPLTNNVGKKAGQCRGLRPPSGRRL